MTEVILGVSQWPWRRGTGSDCHKVFDAQGSTVCEHAGTNDGNLIAAAPELFNAILKSDDAHWTPAMRAAMTKAGVTFR